MMKSVLHRFFSVPGRVMLLFLLGGIAIASFGCMGGGGGGTVTPGPDDRSEVAGRVQSILNALESGDSSALAGFRRSAQDEYISGGGTFLPLFVHDLGDDISTPDDNATHTFFFNPDDIVFPTSTQAMATAWTWYSDGGKLSLRLWLEKESEQWYLTEIEVAAVDLLQAAGTSGPLPSSVLWPMARDNRWQFVEILAEPGASTRPRGSSRVSAMVLNATRANFRNLVIGADPTVESGDRQIFRLQMSAYEADVSTSGMELPVDPGIFEFGRFSNGVSAVDRGFFTTPAGAVSGASLWAILDPSRRGFIRAFEDSGLYLEGADTGFNEGRPWRLADVLVREGVAATQTITLAAPGNAARTGEARILIMESIPVTLPWIQGLARRFDISLTWSGSAEVTWTSLFFLPGMGLIGYAEYDLATRHPVRFAWLWGASVGSREFLPPGDTGALDQFISLYIQQPDLLRWTVGIPFTQPLTASGGQEPHAWSLTGAPSWLAIDAGTGVLSGTPEQPGSYSFDVSLSDAGDRSVSLTVQAGVATAPAPVVSGITPAEGFLGGSLLPVSLTGQNFFGVPQVRLASSTGPGLTATGLTLVDAGRISCTLPLSGIATGLWSIEVINPDGQIATGENLFRVRPEPASVPVILEQAAVQNDPSGGPVIRFTAVFARPVTGFTAEDVILAGTAAPATCTVIEAAPNDGTTYDVAISGMTGDGTVTASIPANIALDIENNGNLPSSSADGQVTYDGTAPTAVLDLAPSQPDPASISPVLFRLTFSESVTGFSGSNVVVPRGLVVSSVSTSDPAQLVYDIAVGSGGTGGTISLAIDPAGISDSAGNALSPVTVAGDSVGFDALAPSVSIIQALSQSDPASTSPILFQIQFSEPVTGFTAADVSLGGTANPTTCAIAQVDAANYMVSVSGMTGNGTVIASVPSSAAFDAVGNGNSPSFLQTVDNVVTYDGTAPAVTINQAASQIDPTNETTALFTVVFSEPVSGFNGADIILGGTAFPATAIVSEVTPMDGTTYEVTVSGMSSDGTITAAVPAGAVQDAVGNPNIAGTSTDNEVTRDSSLPFVTGISTLTGNEIEVTFSAPMGEDVVTLGSYMISGDSGSLAANPDSVTPAGGNTFLLKWNTGLMTAGSTVTVKVSNVHDAAGKPIGKPDAATGDTPLAVIEMVVVGDPGNAPETAWNTNCGAVATVYQIGKYEVTNAQYCAFLNAVAKTDTYGLYSPLMDYTNPANRGGIRQLGISGSFVYDVGPNFADKPVNYISFYGAARFANWLHNGAKATSSTETGAYTITGGGNNSGTVGNRNPGCRFMIPTQDEWFKAAFYKGGGINAGYWRNAMRSDSATPLMALADATGNVINPGPDVANHNNSAIWNGQSGHVTTVGACGTPSAYGTFDQSGNLWEWNETVSFLTSHVIRGGGWNIAAYALLSSSGNFAEDAASRQHIIGFRVGR